MSMSQRMYDVLKMFEGKNVVVIGDVMVDHYLYGKTTRISQEAPVPIVLEQISELRLGGAAHVALNLKMVGANVILAGVYGEDREGNWLDDRLDYLGIRNSGYQAEEVATIVKQRVIANGAQVCRIDREHHPDCYARIFSVQFLLDSGRIDAIFISDYDKGTVSFELMQNVRECGIPFFCDPKSRELDKYRGADGITPNRLEVERFDLRPMSFQQAVAVNDIKSVLLTKGEDGVSFWETGMLKPMCLPGHRKDIADPCGAGDTAFAIYGLSKTCGASTAEAAAMANFAASLVVEKPGVVPITRLALVHALTGD